jgi:TRAP-type mannitol/chloroaromatic compound transport system substrate-binding protein
LRDEGRVKIAKFDVSVLNAVHGLSKDVVADLGTRDELSKKIYASYVQFRNSIADWGEISGRYLSSRTL